MGLYDALAEITEEENKALGEDVEAAENEPTHAETPKEKPAAKEKPDPENAGEGEEKASGDGKPPAADKKAAADPAAKAADPAPAEGALTPQDFARLRREKAISDRRAEAAEAALKKPVELAAQPARTATEKAVLAEPDKNLDPEAHMRWELAQTKEQLREVREWKAQKDQEEQRVNLRAGAVKEFSKYENDFMPTVTDYKEVTTHGIQQITRSISTLNPNLKGEELNEAVRMQVLRLGAQAEQRGEDPAEFFYNQSKAWGYQPKGAEPTAEEKAAAAAAEKKAAPSMKDIAAHKKRSPTSLTPGGKSGNAPLSKEAVMSKNFTVADFAKLTPTQLRQLEEMEA